MVRFKLSGLPQDDAIMGTSLFDWCSAVLLQDIRNQHRYRQQRKMELKRLSETLEKLSRKATFYEEQMDYYHQYVKACLDQLAMAGGKGRVQGSGQQGGSGFKKQSIKYNAHKLHEKGVILEIEGLPNHQWVRACVVALLFSSCCCFSLLLTLLCIYHCRFRNVSFEITSIDIGVFEVTGRFLGRQIEKVELVFQVRLWCSESRPLLGCVNVLIGSKIRWGPVIGWSFVQVLYSECLKPWKHCN